MIRVSALTKSFTRRQHLFASKSFIAVDKLSFSVDPGTIYALLGPNGSGKTTTFKCISSLYRTGAGSITVMGHDCAREAQKVRESIGFLSSEIKLSGHQSCRDVLEFYGRLNKLEHHAMQKRMKWLAELFDLHSFWGYPIEKYSTGQRQRAALAVSVIHDPQVLLFDEPTNGLDILAAQAVWDFLRTEKKRGKTILLSTHIIDEAVRVADQIGLLLSGRLRIEGSPEQLRETYKGKPLQDVFLELIKTDIVSGKDNHAD